MHSLNRQNQTDVIVLVESTGFIGVCFDQIKANYLNPILQFIYGLPINDESGVANDVR